MFGSQYNSSHQFYSLKKLWSSKLNCILCGWEYAQYFQSYPTNNNNETKMAWPGFKKMHQKIPRIWISFYDSWNEALNCLLHMQSGNPQNYHRTAILEIKVMEKKWIVIIIITVRKNLRYVTLNIFFISIHCFSLQKKLKINSFSRYKHPNLSGK